MNDFSNYFRITENVKKYLVSNYCELRRVLESGYIKYASDDLALEMNVIIQVASIVYETDVTNAERILIQHYENRRENK